MEGAAEAPPGVQGQRPCSAPQRQEACVFRESTGFEKQLAQPQRNRSPLLSLLQGNRPKPPSRGRWIREIAPDRTKPEGVHPVAWLTAPLLIDCCVTCTFSPARKYQRASGVAKFSLEIATPDPLRSNLELFPSFLRSNRLAGAGRGSWTRPLLGAASRGSATQPPAQQAAFVELGGVVTWMALRGRRFPLTPTSISGII